MSQLYQHVVNNWWEWENCTISQAEHNFVIKHALIESSAIISFWGLELNNCPRGSGLHTAIAAECQSLPSFLLLWGSCSKILISTDCLLIWNKKEPCLRKIWQKFVPMLSNFFVPPPRGYSHLDNIDSKVGAEGCIGIRVGVGISTLLFSGQYLFMSKNNAMNIR